MARCNHINKAQVGQVIRAYDFPGTTDHYIQGTVIEKGLVIDPVRNIALCEGYTIKVKQEGPADDGDRIGHKGYVPFKQMIGDYEKRVELIEETKPIAKMTMREIKQLMYNNKYTGDQIFDALMKEMRDRKTKTSAKKVMVYVKSFSNAWGRLTDEDFSLLREIQDR